MPELIRSAGFVEVHESARYMTLFGTLSLYASSKALIEAAQSHKHSRDSS